jgi:hypothetical protein
MFSSLRRMKLLLVLLSMTMATALHPWQRKNASSTGSCIVPGQCTPPPTTYSRVIAGPAPGQQWNINGGFCGAFSIQQSSLAFGAWISQDLVRKANRDQTGIAHNMHGNQILGYEIVPTDVAYTAAHLKLDYEEWDYNQSAPQAPAYKRWLKKNLVKGYPIVWMPLCKGDPHLPYPGSCPNGGAIDHVEPIFGIFSNHPLDDLTVYDDDWILHASDQDLLPYYRPFPTLQDSKAMDGNCLHAQAGFGKNEMYPCFDESVTYGLAVKGLAVTGSLPVSLKVDIVEEPNVRSGDKPTAVHGEVTVSGLKAGTKYTLYRYGSTEALPNAQPFEKGAEYTHTFVASGATWTYKDPTSFLSNSATYYLAADAQ